METNVQNSKMSMESKNESKLKKSLKNTHIFYNVFYLTILVIVILLFLLCNGKAIKNELSLQTDLLKKEAAADSIYWNLMLQKMDIQINLDSALLKGQDSTNALLFNLTKCCERNTRKLSQILSELKGVGEGIDSIQNLLVSFQIQAPDSALEVTKAFPEETIQKIWKVQITKNIFDKKGNLIGTTNLVDNSSPIAFSSLTGFSKDSLNMNYPYLNQDKGTSVLGFTGLLSGNVLSLDAVQGQNSLYSEKKTIPSGKAGIDFLQNSNDFQLNYTTHRFYELIFDQNKFNRGKLECIAGPIIAAVGGFGVGYYATNPSVTVKVYQGDKLIGEDKTYNVPMIVTSGLATLGGVGLTIKGCIDKKFSWKLTPTEISASYSIGSK